MKKLKTKKDILNWYLDIGNKIENNDYKEFWEKIDKSLLIDEKVKGTGEKQKHCITILKRTWKYPLKLYFYNLECYKIVGF